MTTPKKVVDPYEEMIAHAGDAGRLWIVWPRTGSEGTRLVTNGYTLPTRDQLLADVTSIPSYSCSRSATGEAVWERREITMETASRWIGIYGTLTENAA